MNPIGILFTLIVCVGLFIVPRDRAAIPILMGAALVTREQELEIASAHFTVIRILVVLGMIRITLKNERIAGGINNIDIFIVLWAAVLFFTSAFHSSAAWMYRAGIIWSELGCYFLLRCFLQGREDVFKVFKSTFLILLPVALFMLIEKATGKNLFGVLYGGDSSALLRNGNFRARGAFSHPILAGTVGAACFPWAYVLSKSFRLIGSVGMLTGLAIVFASKSSGPIMMLMFTLFAMMLWPYKKYLAMIRWAGLLFVLVLDAAMKDPIYYLMARIDLSGGSQGYFRARLIQSSIERLNEWWLAGTDYTRHWMSTGIHANSTATDITNHFLAMGVMGGFPLMLLWVMVLVSAFSSVGESLKKHENAPPEQQFLIWTLGAVLFGHITNYFSISYFDNSVIFFYLLLACIGAVAADKSSSQATKEVNAKVDKRPVYFRYRQLGKAS